MRATKRKVLVGLAAVFVMAVTAVMVWPRKKEPEYQGKRLSEWLTIYQMALGGARPASYKEAEDAVHHIGTNGLPWLVRWIRHSTKPFQKKLWDRLHPMAVRVLGQERLFRYRYPEVLAYSAFNILRKEAKPAIPELLQIIQNNGETNQMIFGALGCTGRDAFLPLLAIATNSALPAACRSAALYQIGVLHYQHVPDGAAVPVLLESLQEPEVRDSAASVLDTLLDLDMPMGLSAETYVSALVPCLESSNVLTQTFAANRLGRFGAHAELAVPALLTVWRRCELEQKQVAKAPIEVLTLKVLLGEAVSNALQKIAPEVLATNGMSAEY